MVTTSSSISDCLTPTPRFTRLPIGSVWPLGRWSPEATASTSTTSGGRVVLGPVSFSRGTSCRILRSVKTQSAGKRDSRACLPSCARDLRQVPSTLQPFRARSQLKDQRQVGPEIHDLLVAVAVESNFEERFWPFSSC